MSSVPSLRAFDATPPSARAGRAVAAARVAGQIAMAPVAVLVTLALALWVSLGAGFGWNTDRY